MKTQIIQLESHDETISVKDKIEWSQTHRVLLIWPRKGKILREQFDLISLERHCASLGSQLALVTKDPEVSFYARRIGLLVFKTRLEAQRKPWRRSNRYYLRKRLQQAAATPREIDLSHSPRKKHIPPETPLWKRLIIFSIGVFAVLAIAALLVPSATVQLFPQSHIAEHTLIVQASPKTEYVHISGFVPAREVTTNVEKRAAIPSSGTMKIPDTFATGKVIFSNLTEQAIVVPKNTILSTAQKPTAYFETTAQVTVPAGLNAEKEVDIQAIEPGTAGNQPAETISAIGSQLGADLKVTNPAPITGGADILIPAPTAKDRETLTQQVLEELESNALTLLEANLSPGDLLLSDTPLIKEIELQSYSPATGQPGDTLELIMRVQFSALIVTGNDLRELGQATMLASQTGNFQPIPDTLQILNLTEPVLQDETAQWEMLVMWKNKPIWNTTEMAQSIVGQNPLLAQDLLAKKYSLDHQPAISLTPAWWPRLPFLPFRVDVGE